MMQANQNLESSPQTVEQLLEQSAIGSPVIQADKAVAEAVASAASKKVSDGYISGATVFADANGNGLLDPGEISTTTDQNGNFNLTGGSGPLVAFGGTDISTGLPFKGQLSAPQNSAVITPLTTLLNDLSSDASADANILAALGLPAGLDLTTFDPIAAAKSGDAGGAAAYVAGAKVYDTSFL